MAALVRRYDEASPDGPSHFPVVFEKTKRLWLNEPSIEKKELAKIKAPTMVMGRRQGRDPPRTYPRAIQVDQERAIVRHTSVDPLPARREAGSNNPCDYRVHPRNQLAKKWKNCPAVGAGPSGCWD